MSGNKPRATRYPAPETNKKEPAREGKGTLTDDEDNRSGQVDPAETHRLAHEQDDQESEDSDTDDRCQRPSLVGRASGRGCSLLRSSVNGARRSFALLPGHSDAEAFVGVDEVVVIIFA
jgi:hypothetical protein